MDNIILTTITRQHLVKEITSEILDGIVELLKIEKLNTHTTDELLTRKDVASLFKISLVSVYEWSKKGILKPHKIGSRVRFKRSEVMAAMIEMETQKG